MNKEIWSGDVKQYNEIDAHISQIKTNVLYGKFEEAARSCDKLAAYFRMLGDPLFQVFKNDRLIK